MKIAVYITFQNPISQSDTGFHTGLLAADLHSPETLGSVVLLAGRNESTQDQVAAFRCFHRFILYNAVIVFSE